MRCRRRPPARKLQKEQNDGIAAPQALQFHQSVNSQGAIVIKHSSRTPPSTYPVIQSHAVGAAGARTCNPFHALLSALRCPTLPGSALHCSALLRSVLFCSVLFCPVLSYVVLSCPVLLCSLPNPTKPTQTNTTTPQHHTPATQWEPEKCKTASQVPEKIHNGAEGAGEMKNWRRRRRFF
eukprot:gene21608-biopygen13210